MVFNLILRSQQIYVFHYLNFSKKKGFEYGYADHSKFGINKKVLDICSNAENTFNCGYIEKHVCYSLK